MDTTNVRVLRETRDKLQEVQFQLQLRAKKRLSMDDVIKELVDAYSAALGNVSHFEEKALQVGEY